MSSLHRSDRHLHHADGSHRWSGGPADARGREGYLAALRDHLEQHRVGFAAPPRRAGHEAGTNRTPATNRTTATNRRDTSDGTIATGGTTGPDPRAG